ncbi:MAG TPA: hypothetical protein VFW08_03485 [bacterium]|nr:hypothetical protein [bacterium]
MSGLHVVLGSSGGVGRALVTLGERDEALGEVWHLPADEAVRQIAQVQER